MEATNVNATYPKYPAYKNSGIEWLGKIPEGWEIRRFKFLFREINERSKDGQGDLLSVSQYTGVTKKADKVEDGGLLSTAATLEGYKKVSKNDLVSNIMLAWNGSLGFSPYNGITSPAYSIYRLNSGNSERFFHYLVRSEFYKAEFKRNSSGVIESRLRLYTDDFFSIWSILPPRPEQTAIANFLDDKCAKIDRAIAQKEKLIALLKERKQVVIQNAVTGKTVWSEEAQAFVPVAESGVEVKDSGVEWIGEVPVGWEVIKLKRGCKKITDGAHISPEIGDKIKPFVSTVNIDDNGLINFENCIYTTQKCYDYLVRTGCKPEVNDVLFSKDGTVGRTSVITKKKDFVIASSLVLIRPELRFFNPEYLELILSSNHVKMQTEGLLSGSALRRISIIKVTNLLVFKLSIEEQIEILNHCKKVTDKTKQFVNHQQAQIERLKEYKATLIDSAVRGKIKVVET